MDSAVNCPIHPTITAVGCSLPLALLISAATQLRFSTISNISFLFAAFFQEFESKASFEKTSLLKSAPTILSLTGAFSFVFHTDMGMHTTLHTLDIFFGWVLALHGAASGVGCALALVLRERGNRMRVLFAVPFALFVTSLHLLAGYYDAVYDWQVGYYGTMAGVIFASGVFVRVHQLRRDLLPIRNHAWRIALLETATILVAAVSALFAQSQQAGIKLEIDSPKYHTYHGLWHIQLALAFSILYTRLLDGVSTSVSCNQNSVSPLDGLALANVWILAISTLLLKELQAPLIATHLVLTCIGLGFVAIALTHWTYMRQFTGTAQTRRKAELDKWTKSTFFQKFS